MAGNGRILPQAPLGIRKPGLAEGDINPKAMALGDEKLT